MKTKIKSHGDKVTDFYDEKNPKVDSNHTCLAVISLDSVLKKDGSYYLQVIFLEVQMHWENVIRDIDDLESSDDSDEE